MTVWQPQPRLTAGSSDAPPALIDAIRTLRQLQGTPKQVAALHGRLQVQLAAAPRGKPGTAATRLAVFGGGALIVALGVWGVRNLERESATRPVPDRRVPADVISPRGASPAIADESLVHGGDPHVPVASSVQILSPQPPDPMTAALQSAPEARPRRNTEPHARIRDARGAATSNRGPSPASSLEAELMLLQRCQQALEQLPARALLLVERHRRLYPRGVFAQEREVIAIEALLKLRDSTGLRACAARFLSQYPGSPHTHRVQKLLGRMAP